MHNVAVVSDCIVHGEATRTTRCYRCGHAEPRPLCPRPHRLRPVAPEIVMRLDFDNLCEGSSSHGWNGILQLISTKICGDHMNPCSGYLPPRYYVGSPPSRTDNPVVHDIEFIRRTETLSSLVRTMLSEDLSFP